MDYEKLSAAPLDMLLYIEIHFLLRTNRVFLNQGRLRSPSQQTLNKPGSLRLNIQYTTCMLG